MRNIHVFKLCSNQEEEEGREACSFTFYGHLIKFVLITPRDLLAFCHNPSNLDHWIAQPQGICGDQQLPRVLRGWCIAQYFPFFLEPNDL